MRRHPLFPIAAAAAGLAIALSSPNALALEPAQNPVLPANLAALVAGEANPDLPAKLGVVVYDTSNGALLHSRRAGEPMTPASTMKLVTAAVALMTYGPDHNFKTIAKWDEASATLYLVGGGDPALQRHHLQRLAAKVRPLLPASAIKVVGDNTLFPEFTEPAGWLDTYLPGEVRPATGLGLGDTRSTNPAKEATKYFVDALKSAGVTARYSGLGASQGVELAKTSGQSLASTVRSMLTHSDNTIAETLFRLSAASTGNRPTWEVARSHALTVLHGLGIDTDGTRLVDGSGLSRSNRLTPTLLGSLLLKSVDPAYPQLQALLDRDLLAIGGKTGTLENRFRTFKTRCAKGRVEAKTGTLRDVAGLAGFVEAKDGSRAAFAILANGVPSRYQLPDVRKAIDLMVAGLAGCSN